MGRKIKALREKQKLSQQGLAARASLSLSFLSRLEQGRHDPSVTTLKKVAKALGVKPADLL